MVDPIFAAPKPADDTGSLVALTAGLAATRPRALRVRSHELPVLAFCGNCGLAFVQCCTSSPSTGSRSGSRS